MAVFMVICMVVFMVIVGILRVFLVQDAVLVLQLLLPLGINSVQYFHGGTTWLINSLRCAGSSRCELIERVIEYWENGVAGGVEKFRKTELKISVPSSSDIE
jgi:hypothetical protein